MDGASGAGGDLSQYRGVDVEVRVYYLYSIRNIISLLFSRIVFSLFAYIPPLNIATLSLPWPLIQPAD